MNTYYGLYHLEKRPASCEKLFEMLKKQQKEKYHGYIQPTLDPDQLNAIIHSKNSIFHVTYGSAAIKSVRIQEILQIYEDTIKKSSSQEEIIKALITAVQELELIHPFRDGNGRTFLMIMINLELIRNGMFPMLQNDPNLLDYLALEDLPQEIKIGIKRFMNYISTGKIDPPYSSPLLALKKPTDIILDPSQYSWNVPTEDKAYIREQILELFPYPELQDLSQKIKSPLQKGITDVSTSSEGTPPTVKSKKQHFFTSPPSEPSESDKKILDKQDMPTPKRKKNKWKSM